MNNVFDVVYANNIISQSGFNLRFYNDPIMAARARGLLTILEIRASRVYGARISNRYFAAISTI